MAGTSDAQALLLTVSADTSKALKQLDALNKKLSDVAGGAENSSKRAGDALSRGFTGEGFGKALDKVFDSSRLAVLEEGGAKLRVFGSALEPLGPLGIAAAAGVAAFALTMERTEKAVEFAAGIAKVGEEVGVTTDFIQKFNFAAAHTEVDVATADQALKGLNASLGLVQSGLAKKGLVNAFAALGFTPDQLRQFQNVGDFFPVLADRIAKVGNAAEQAAIVQRLGIPELLPLLKLGADGFNGLAQKAADLGVVLDHATIEKATQAKKKLDELDAVMKAKSMVTFAQFADTLLTVKQAFLDAEAAGLKFLAIITGTTPAKVRIKELSEQLQTLLKQGAQNEPAGRTLLKAKTDELNRLVAKEAAVKPEEAPKATGKVPALVPDDAAAKAAAAAAKKAAEQQKRFDSALAKDQDAILAAHDNEMRSVQERTAIAKARLDLEDKSRATELEDQVQTGAITEAQRKVLAAADKRVSDAKHEELAAKAKREIEDAQIKAARDLTEADLSVLQAKRDLVKSTEERAVLDAAILKRQQDQSTIDLQATLGRDPNKSPAQKAAELTDKSERDRLERVKQADQAADRLASEALDRSQAQLDGQAELLQIELSLAVTAAQRRNIELRLLDLAEQRERAELEAILASKTASDADKEIARIKLGQLSGLAPGRAEQVRASTRGPVESFVHDNRDPARIAENMQAAGVKAFENLADGLADAIVNAKSLGDVAKNVFRQLIADFLSQEIRKAGAGLFEAALGVIPHFASGTGFAPGGLSLVGERGPELVNLPRGAAVFPNSALGGVRSMQPIVHQTVVFDNRGAVIWEDAQMRLQQYADNAAARTAIMAYQGARADIPATMAKSASNRLGR